MTLRYLGPALLAVLILLSPAVTAEASESEPERPDDAAWVEDCPPDMMCAAGSGNSTEPGRTSDCDTCRDHQDKDCVDCLGAPADDTTWGTDCPPGVYCMSDGAPADPDDAAWVDCGGEVCAYNEPAPETVKTEANEAPTSSVAVTTGLALLALAGVARRGLR